MELRRFLPIGIQTFSQIREFNAVYVDKTDLVYKLANEGKVYFLSRPRRFGKSLLLSTLNAYFSGEKELFTGLALEKLETKWTKYPVLHFDMSFAKHTDLKGLKEVLDTLLEDYEKVYGITEKREKFSLRLKTVIDAARLATGQKVVILIDEYDTPLLDTLADEKTLNAMRMLLRDFFSPLKAMDQHLRFVFLTGITKFSQLSIFSELNNLNNISMEAKYAAICGITEDELKRNFVPEIECMAKHNHWSHDETIRRLKKKYDGYHFCEESPDIYNPFSVLKSLSEEKPGSYWFSTGTPTALAEQIGKFHALEPLDLDQGIWASQSTFDIPVEQSTSPIPLMYQSGYLSIKEYVAQTNLYRLAYPNEEVRDAFCRCLVPYYANVDTFQTDTFLIKFVNSIRAHDIDGAMKLARAFVSSVPYMATEQNENYYRTVIYLLCRLASPYAVRVEQMSAAGRADMIIETEDAVFCFEFKLRGSAQTAIKQIEEKGYLLPYELGDRKLYKIGCAFDKKKKTLGRWIIIEG